MSKIIIIGLGPGSFENLTLEAKGLLENKNKLFLRTKIHPLVQEFSKYEIEYESCDHFYEQSDNFNHVYEMIADFIIKKASEYGTIQYAVPGHPLVLEETVELISKRAKKTNIDVEIIPGLSALESIYSLLEVYPAKGLIVLDALDLPESSYWSGKELLITQVHNKLVASDLKLTLLDYYPPNYNLKIIKAAGVINQEKVTLVELAEMDWLEYDHLTSVYLPKVELNNTFEDLIQIVERLRSENGCPWDREQTHRSLQTSLLEETYEVLETIQEDNKENMCEELGDLLLQIAFHSVLADEEYFFSYRDVVSGIIKKMIRRHPHVFGGSKICSSKEVLKTWEEIKQKEKGDAQKSVLSNIPTVLPALLQADKIQRKAAGAGFDWDEVEEVWNKVYEELQELSEADQDQQLDELGDVLFSIVNLARFLHIDAESALFSTIRKFKQRFQYIEQQIGKTGKSFNDYTLAELDAYWELAKNEKE